MIMYFKGKIVSSFVFIYIRYDFLDAYRKIEKLNRKIPVTNNFYTKSN